MPASPYATTDDLAGYLADNDVVANKTILTSFLSAASRFIDSKCGQYFYADGVGTKQFNGEGGNYLDTGKHSFYVKAGTIAACSAGATTITYTKTQGPAPVVNDVFVLGSGPTQESVTASAVSGTGSPYTLTVGALAFAHAAATTATTFRISLAYFENQPRANWLGPLGGDGVLAPSNYFLVPRNPGNDDSAADTSALRPYYGVELAVIPIAGSNYLPNFLPGNNTVEITTYWGWPQVPDDIKHLTCTLAAKLWRSRGAGWSEVVGSSEIGTFEVMKYFNAMDQFLLKSSGFIRWSF